MKRIHIVWLACVGVVCMLHFASCEKDITVDLPDAESQVVVEGYIFQGQRPWVLLSKNAGYFDPIDSAAILNSMITDAVVTVSDGTNTDTLTFQQANISPIKYAYVKQGATVIGQPGKTYTLTVITGGETLTSTTTIVPPIPVDSARFKLYNDPGDTLGLIWTYFTDPGIDERAYRIFSRRVSQIKGRNQRLFRPNTLVPNSMFKGQSYYFGIGLADKYGDNLSEDNVDHADKKQFRVGDTVKVRLCTCDLVTYHYLDVLETALDKFNFFSSPVVVPTNINGGLGSWQGYGVTEFQIICNP